MGCSGQAGVSEDITSSWCWIRGHGGHRIRGQVDTYPRQPSASRIVYHRTRVFGRNSSSISCVTIITISFRRFCMGYWTNPPCRALFSTSKFGNTSASEHRRYSTEPWWFGCIRCWSKEALKLVGVLYHRIVWLVIIEMDIECSL